MQSKRSNHAKWKTCTFLQRCRVVQFSKIRVSSTVHRKALILPTRHLDRIKGTICSCDDNTPHPVTTANLATSWPQDQEPVERPTWLIVAKLPDLKYLLFNGHEIRSQPWCMILPNPFSSPSFQTRSSQCTKTMCFEGEGKVGVRSFGKRSFIFHVTSTSERFVRLTERNGRGFFILPR